MSNTSDDESIEYTRLFWRYGEPVCMMECDRMQGHATLEYEGHIFQLYSKHKEVWGLQLKNGIFLIGVGNPFYHRGYREELSCAVAKDKATYEWLRDSFNKCGIHTVEQSVMFEIKGTTRITVDKNEMWRLFLADGTIKVGTLTVYSYDQKINTFEKLSSKFCILSVLIAIYGESASISFRGIFIYQRLHENLLIDIHNISYSYRFIGSTM